MNFPAHIWNHKLENGQILAEFVDDHAPSTLPLSDLDSFKEIWNNRLADAQRGNHKDLVARATSILRFLSQHSGNVYLLMWPKHRISVLFSEHPETFLLIDESMPCEKRIGANLAD